MVVEKKMTMTVVTKADKKRASTHGREQRKSVADATHFLKISISHFRGSHADLHLEDEDLPDGDPTASSSSHESHPKAGTRVGTAYECCSKPENPQHDIIAKSSVG